MNRCMCGGNLADVITPGQFGDVIDSGLGDVGVSVGVSQGGVSVGGNASLLWLGIAGVIGYLYWKR